MSRLLFLVFGSLFLFTLSFLLPGILHPSDILTNLPSFREETFVPPKNSLLFDVVTQFEPWRLFAKKEFLSGNFPLWNPSNGGGVPFLANPQTATFFPLMVFYYVFPTSVGLYALHLTKLLLLGLFTFMYLRSIQRSKESSILGTIAVSFSGFSITWLQWPHTNVFLFFPLLLFLTERIKRNSKNRYRYFFIGTITYFFAVTGGHPETLFHVALLHCIYSVVRLHSDRKKIITVLGTVFIGLLLGAFLIFPFAEYLLHSQTLVDRLATTSLPTLSLITFLQFFLPFLAGGPHLQFYRPLTHGSNFQEAIGGYVGPIVFLTAVYGFVKYRANALIRFWIAIALIVFIHVYAIWPLSLLQAIPGYALINNTRLIGFLVFGFATSFAMVFDSINDKHFLKAYRLPLVVLLVSVTASAFTASWVLSTVFTVSRLSLFMAFLLKHIGFMVATTVLFFLAVSLSNKKLHFTFIASALLVLSQTILLLYKYNPIIDKKQYYPQTELVKVLLSLPPGKILEVGNMSIPENINLVYGLDHAESYDAIGVASYEQAFMKAFPIRNRWGNVDEVTLEALREFGIRYVIADYDIRHEKVSVFSGQNELLTPKGDTLAKGELRLLPRTLKGIRLMFATHNRNNTCNVTLMLFDPKHQQIESHTISCTNFSNYSFFTFPLDIVSSSYSHETIRYEITVSGHGHQDFVSLVGEDNMPYMDVLYEKREENNLNLVWSREDIFVFENVDGGILDVEGSAELIEASNTSRLWIVKSKRPQNIVIRYPQYPGWHVFVDGRRIALDRSDPFFTVPVSAGLHTIRLSYKPGSVFLGLFISVITLTIFISGLLRFQRSSIQKVLLRYQNTFASRAKGIAFFQHAIIVTVGLLISIMSYLALISLAQPTFTVPETTAINWFTVHNYPRQQDYFYFFTAMPYVFSVTFTVWFFWIWRKGKR